MTTSTPDRVDVAGLRQRLTGTAPASVIDVRTPAEYETAHIDGAINVPLAVIESHAPQVAGRLDGQVVLMCQSGTRAEQARRRLAAAGADGLHVLDGNVEQYAATGGDVVRGRARWSLERQVRLVAGTLVLAGITAGLRVPKARWLAAGIGAGLTVSALTDTCTMGRILSALPYNSGPRDRTADEIIDRLPATTA
ncbi:sulfurtransferase [Actinoplanes italicus]|uniref:Rhodanese-related sulfurtransferase n=1 Tax=Actinoplanes italicus TaxID=113567 RepID=A0A2T0KPD0_9ACTN|nr:rhodanese-like domain-containing protein [Actinoplanes italicus]PRX25597.1 rhodanese-related sulfurtransferase [Actinoplanes italicus]GIE28958.1 sulfurtransferase [Actinoplanes italicus]